MLNISSTIILTVVRIIVEVLVLVVVVVVVVVEVARKILFSQSCTSKLIVVKIINHHRIILNISIINTITIRNRI